MEKFSTLYDCVGIIDGTVFDIARPDEYALQNACYNGHKKRHLLKFQTVTTPGDLIIQSLAPAEGRSHDRKLHGLSDIDEKLSEAFLLDAAQ